jgi:uncharacterized protein
MLAAVVMAGIVAVTQIPQVVAGAILHPARRVDRRAAPPGCIDRRFDGAGVRLQGWFCSAAGSRRGSMVMLHGVADTRASVAGLVERYARKGFDTVAYDSRAHGESEGEFCTYGFWEKQDLRRVVATLPDGPVILVGTSLGAAVSLQEAAHDPRIAAVVAAEVFSDLESVVRDRTPWFVPSWIVASGFRVAEKRASFSVDAASPARAAASIAIPVLLVHGAADIDTPPEHSRRVLAALRGPKRLILVDGARHNESLRGARTWDAIDDWIDVSVTEAAARASR